MKALIKTKTGKGNVALIDINEPDGPLDNEIKLQVKAVGICGSDIHILEDNFPYYDPPIILGHEFSGEVVACGKGVKKFKIGDRVVILGSAAIICGECRYCRSGNFIYCSSRKGMGNRANGAMTEFVVVRESLAYKIPPEISYDEAALVEPVSCCLQAVEYLTPIYSGNFCLISGPGPIGLICLILLKKRNIITVLSGLERDEFRLSIGRKLGADCIVMSDKEKISEVIKKEFIKDSFDVSVECSGSGESLANCFDLTASMGSIIQIGLFNKDVILDFNKVVTKKLKIFGLMGFTWDIWQASYELIMSGKIDVKPVITHKFPLNEWEKAFAAAASPKSGKVIITSV